MDVPCDEHAPGTIRDALDRSTDIGWELGVIMVRDPGLSRAEAQPRPGQTTGGWGLVIVDQLAQRWGTERTDGYCVWAEMAAPTTDVTRYDLPPENYRLTVGGLNTANLSVTATDPLTGSSVPVSVTATSPTTAQLLVPLTDYPRLLVINDA
jgi:hypothetical protein